MSEYAEILLPMEGSLDDESVNQFGLVTTGNLDEYYLVQTSNSGYRMMPGPEFSPRLYRGQSKRYASCKPSLFRGDYQYIDLLYWTAKRVELGIILSRHPAVNDIMSWDFDGLIFDFNLQSVAQHYQYPTQMLDLSRNRDIAMFFATHDFTISSSRPKPAVGNEAVIYTIDVKTLLNTEDEDHRFIPIGIDPLPRSAAQKAFGLELDISGDLEKMAGVHAETFIVTEELAIEAASKVGGYDGLFPFDPFEEHIATVKNSRKIALEAIDTAVSVGLMPLEYTSSIISNMLVSVGYVIDTASYVLPQPKIIAEAAYEWQRQRENYTRMIRWRGVSDSL